MTLVCTPKERERERERERNEEGKRKREEDIYIYIHTYIYVCIIHMYAYRESGWFISMLCGCMRLHRMRACVAPRIGAQCTRPRLNAPKPINCNPRDLLAKSGLPE